MTKNDSREKEQPALQPKGRDAEGALASGLERLAFKLHDLANRLLRYIS